MTAKPLGHRAYGSIGHLPNSRLGPSDHHIHEGQARILCGRTRDKHDLITVQEKVDGSCMSVAKLPSGEVIPLGRAGYPAWTSPYHHLRMFSDWAWDNKERFERLLEPGERVVGEWLAMAVGTRYDLPHEPFVVFDIMRVHSRMPAADVKARAACEQFTTPRVLHTGGPFSIEEMLAVLEPSGHGAMDPVEGAVWRCERKGKVDFLGKFVRPDKVDGVFLNADPPVWNWAPMRGFGSSGWTDQFGQKWLDQFGPVEGER